MLPPARCCCLVALLLVALGVARGASPNGWGGAEDLVREYERQRASLVAELSDGAWTADVEKRLGWSPAERKASARVADLRRRVVTQPGYRDAPWEAQPFLAAMPKGAILHVHSVAMGDYGKLVDAAASYRSPGDGRVFWVADNSSVADDAHLFVLAPAAAAPAGYAELSRAVASAQARRRVVELLLLTGYEAAAPGDPWRFFGPVFQRVAPLLAVEDVAVRYYADALRHLADVDRVSHVELRAPWVVEREALPGTDEHAVLAALALVNGNGTARLTMRAIWCDSRHAVDTAAVRRNMRYVGEAMARAAASGRPSVLAGYDLVGEEDTGSPSHRFLRDVAEALVEHDGTLYPTFFFHDGESSLPPDYSADVDDDAAPADVGFNNNMVDALLLNGISVGGSSVTPGRVGHGLAMAKTPGLIERAGIAVELCPVSNQLLGYTRDLREHPGRAYLDAGVAVSLSPDDPAIYGYQGVTHDFWEATVAWNLDLRRIKMLCYYSLRYSTLPAAEREQHIDRWLREWDAWVAKINEVY
eukprot:m51a1_g6244 adenosine deaminase, putative (531) ;mRNA; f:23539-25953